MDYTLTEIINHKTNIINLSNNLFNRADVNQEIALNEELIKQAQFLLKLLNIKKNLIFDQNFQNNNMNNIFNPIQNNQMIMFNNINNNQFQQMMNQNTMNQPQVPQRKEINLKFFNRENKSVKVSCFTDEKLSEIIKRYKNMAEIGLNNNYFKFLYNGKTINPNKTVGESEVLDGTQIIVVDPKKAIIGG